MSNFEIFIIIIACAIPLVALLFVLPKFKKKDNKKVENPTKTLEELKKEEKKPEPVNEEPVKKEDISSEINSEEIQSYIDFKKKNITTPKRVEAPHNFKDVTMPYMPRRRKVEKKPQSVVEEIQNLSPELKALIIAGVLDKKDY